MVIFYDASKMFSLKDLIMRKYLSVHSEEEFKEGAKVWAIDYVVHFSPAVKIFEFEGNPRVARVLENETKYDEFVKDYDVRCKIEWVRLYTQDLPVLYKGILL